MTVVSPALWPFYFLSIKVTILQESKKVRGLFHSSQEDPSLRPPTVQPLHSVTFSALVAILYPPTWYMVSNAMSLTYGGVSAAAKRSRRFALMWGLWGCSAIDPSRYYCVSVENVLCRYIHQRQELRIAFCLGRCRSFIGCRNGGSRNVAAF